MCGKQRTGWHSASDYSDVDVRDCGYETFDVVVLERCAAIEQLNACEPLWIDDVSACERWV